MALLADPRNNIPTSASSPEQWMSFADDCVSAMGQKAGMQVWLKFWANRGNSSVNTSALREYMKKYNVNLSATNIFGSIVDSSKDVVSGIENTVGGILHMGKIATYIVLGTTAAAILAIAIGAATHPKEVGQMIKTAAV